MSLSTQAQNKIAKFRAKEISISNTTGERTNPSMVDFLVAFDFSLSRITFFREKKETYDIIKTLIKDKDEKGDWSIYECTDENLNEYEITFFIPSTQDKVVFSVHKRKSSVKTTIICAYL